MDKNEIIARAGYFRTKAGLSQKALSMDIEMNWAMPAKNKTNHGLTASFWLIRRYARGLYVKY